MCVLLYVETVCEEKQSEKKKNEKNGHGHKTISRSLSFPSLGNDDVSTTVSHFFFATTLSVRIYRVPCAVGAARDEEQKKKKQLRIFRLREIKSYVILRYCIVILLCVMYIFWYTVMPFGSCDASKRHRNRKHVVFTLRVRNSCLFFASLSPKRTYFYDFRREIFCIRSSSSSSSLLFSSYSVTAPRAVRFWNFSIFFFYFSASAAPPPVSPFSKKDIYNGPLVHNR